jgi:hypothetical protein
MPEPQEITAGVRQLLKSQQGALGRLRITLYGGVHRPQLLLSLVEFTPWPPHVSVNISPWTRNVNSAITGAKSASYAENAVALNLAKEMNYAEPNTWISQDLLLARYNDACRILLSDTLESKGFPKPLNLLHFIPCRFEDLS